MHRTTRQTPDAQVDAPVSPERGMRWLLAALIALIVIADILDINMSLGPGLSGKNALLYVVAVALAFKMIVQQSFVFDLRALHVCFALLILYSLLSIFVAYFVVQYPRYSFVGSGITLKTKVVDHAIFFLVFFYALRETRNAHTVIKVLLCAVVLGNAVALFNALGWTSIGDMHLRNDGRMTGVMGESNQDGAFVSLFLPGLVAALILGRGVWRTWWFAGLVVSLGVIVLTASRGAFVAVLVAGFWGVLVFRRYVPLRRLMAIAAGTVAIVVAVFGVMSIRYSDLLYKRVVGDSTSSDMVGASSGRLEIWSDALALMSQKPLTFLTGYGWNVYWSLPTRLSPHNHYLSLWFNVGVIGLVCGTLLLILVVREAISAIPYAPARYRPVLISFAIGTVAVATATFFVDLFAPWLWFWAYAGLTMRMAVNLRAEATEHVVAPTAAIEQPRQSDAFGWVRTARP